MLVEGGPRTTRTDTLFLNTWRCRSCTVPVAGDRHAVAGAAAAAQRVIRRQRAQADAGDDASRGIRLEAADEAQAGTVTVRLPVARAQRRIQRRKQAIERAGVGARKRLGHTIGRASSRERWGKDGESLGVDVA